MNKPLVQQLLESDHAKTKAVLNWITQVRSSMSEPKTEAEIAVEKTIDELFSRARREEHAAYMATLETPDADDYDQ